MRKLILASLTISAAVSLHAQNRGSVQQRVTRLLDQPPFDRATWNIFAQDERGRVLFNRNGDHFSVPASNTKLIVAATATVLLPATYRVRTSLYANGTIANGILQGDLILYGRGDPTWSERCYTIDTLAAGGCDSTWTVMDAIADSLRAHGLRRVTGKIVGDGSYFEPSSSIRAGTPSISTGGTPRLFRVSASTTTASTFRLRRGRRWISRPRLPGIPTCTFSRSRTARVRFRPNHLRPLATTSSASPGPWTSGPRARFR